MSKKVKKINIKTPIPQYLDDQSKTDDQSSVFLSQKGSVDSKSNSTKLFLTGDAGKNIEQEITQAEDDALFSESTDFYHYFEKFDSHHLIRQDELNYIDKFYSDQTSINQKIVLVSPIYSNLVCTFYCIMFGLIFITLADDILEIQIEYGLQCKNEKFCNIEFNVTDYMISPIYIYYELSEFYQIHPDFAGSISPQQMRGLELNNDQYSQYCDGNDNLTALQQGTRKRSAAGFVLDFTKKANPCGTAAKYNFNDSFLLYKLPMQEFSLYYINQTSISFVPDRKYKYIHHPYFQFRQWLDVENEVNMNWLNIQSQPKLYKLWGRLENDMDVGSFKLVVYNNYNSTSIFGGTKKLYITTLSSFGGKEYKFAYLMFGLAVFYFVSGIVLWIKFLITKSKNLKVKQQMLLR